MRRMFISTFTIAALFTLMNVSSLFAHCQIPCGIYGDLMRIQMLQEHVTTIEKSMSQINALSKAENVNYNQLVRWINNKDHHAQEVQNIVDAYFLTQRIKPVAAQDQQAYAAYSKKVVILHQMLVQAMKAKQSTDVSHCRTLESLIEKFSKMYFSQEDLKHLKVHE